MNVLLVHNYYQQAGGEDSVFAEEQRLLSGHGHRVASFTLHNDAVDGMGKLELARKTIWNRGVQAGIRKAVAEISADIVHFHNTFPLVSPAAYYAAHDAGAAVVQTLHNYRLMCPTATLYRDGKVCEDCVGRAVAWPGVIHKCYRGNRIASAAVAAMLAFHRAKGTWQNEVDAYIALTEFSKSKMIQAGLPERKIVVKPNFVDPDPGPGPGDGGFALFVGRLTVEKGIRTAIAAWQTLPAGSLNLKIVGDGPLRAEVEAAQGGLIEYAGRRPPAEVYDLMGRAAMLIFPSEWYEGLPRTIVESFAKGTPVVASRLGSMTELIADGRNGKAFAAGNAAALAATVQSLGNDGVSLSAMRAAARAEFDARYTAEPNYRQLMSCYEFARQGMRERTTTKCPAATAEARSRE